jgi:hypothetical protein
MKVNRGNSRLLEYRRMVRICFCSIRLKGSLKSSVLCSHACSVRSNACVSTDSRVCSNEERKKRSESFDRTFSFFFSLLAFPSSVSKHRRDEATKNKKPIWNNVSILTSSSHMTHSIFDAEDNYPTKRSEVAVFIVGQELTFSVP